MAERDATPSFSQTQLGIIRKYVRSKLRAQELIEELAEEFLMIPRNLDPLEWLVRQDVARTVGTVCSHGLGGGRCPFELSSQHIQAPAYARYDAPETSDYPIPLEPPPNATLKSFIDEDLDEI